jgi:predicted RNA binding protein YcfA (HicA-like mRNA interferase family)
MGCGRHPAQEVGVDLLRKLLEAGSDGFQKDRQVGSFGALRVAVVIR